MAISKRSIFIVDDSEDNLILCREILSRHGYEVRTAASVMTAYEELLRKPYPDLLLVDCLMSMVSGEEFLIELRQKLPELFEVSRVVGFSGVKASSPLTEGLRKQVDGFIEKAMDIHELVKRVDSEWSLSPVGSQLGKGSPSASEETCNKANYSKDQKQSQQESPSLH